MSLVKELLREIKEKNGNDFLKRKQLVALEQAKLKELIGLRGKCDKCPRTNNLTLEHIVPKDTLKMFGVDTDRTFIEDNYGISCKLCNIFKGNRLDFSYPETKIIISRLLEKL